MQKRKEVNVKAKYVVVGDVTVEERPRKILRVLTKKFLNPKTGNDTLKVYLVVNDRNARGLEFRELDAETFVRVKRLSSVNSYRVRKTQVTS